MLNVKLEEKLVSQLGEEFKLKDTYELVSIWKKNDRSEYTNTAFAAIRQLLIERGEKLPPQDKYTDEIEASSKGFSRKLVNGDYGLAKTCWLYGAWVGFLMNIVFKGFAAHAGVLAILFLVYTPYKILVIMGTWRAANKYEGPKIWAILAKIAVVLSIITLVFSSVVIVVLLSQG